MKIKKNVIKEVAMLFFVYLMFGLIGLVAFVIPEGYRGWAVAIGFASILAPVASGVVLGKTDALRAVQLLNKKNVVMDKYYDSNVWSLWHAFRAPLIAIAPIALCWMVAVIIGAFDPTNAVASAFRMIVYGYYSGYSGIWFGFGFELTSAAFSVMWIYLIIFVVAVATYSVSYYVHGLRAKRTFREIAVEVGINRRG